MADVRLSVQARADLAEIDAHSVAAFGIDAAVSLANEFRDAFAFLAEYPLSSPERAVFGTAIRCKVLKRHRLLYRAEKATVLIVRVLHHARDFSPDVQ